MVHADAGAFLARAEAWMLAREAEHNLVLGIAMAEAQSETPTPDTFFATVEEEGGVVGVCFRTPPHKLCLSAMPLDAAPGLVAEVAARYETIPAVLGPEDVATAVAAEWVALRGGSHTVGMRQRLHRLERVISAPFTPGRMRTAEQEDAALLLEWMAGFAADTSPQFAVPDEQVVGWIDEGTAFLWDDDGPVALARLGGGTPNGMRVGYVYTPPERRRRGYATALVAALSQVILDMGFTYCALYTDLANPTSNSIYGKVGYVPLADVVDVDIEGM